MRGTTILDLNRPRKSSEGKQVLSKGGSKDLSKNNKPKDEGTVKDEDADINLAKNLLESLQGQADTAGPA